MIKYMDADKKINNTELPQQPERTTTRQPEEFIDLKANEKDKGDVPGRDGNAEAEPRRQQGDQETG